MLPSSRYFKETGYYSERAHCQFAGHSIEPVITEDSSTFLSSSNMNTNSISNGDTITTTVQIVQLNTIDEDDPSYSTVPTDHFQGYYGYFASSSSPPPVAPKRGLLPTPTTKPSPNANIVRPIQRYRINQQHRQQKRKFPTKYPMNTKFGQCRPNKTTQQMDRHTVAQDLAVINDEIDKLQEQLQDESETVEMGEEFEQNTDEDELTADDMGYDPEEMPPAKIARYSNSSDNNGANSSSDEQYQPMAASTSSASTSKMSAYRPTPIGDLKKLGFKNNKLLKDGWIQDLEAKYSTSALPKKYKPAEKMVATKSAALLDRTREIRKTSASVTSVKDLFGDDSDSEFNPIATGRQKVKASVSSTTKESPEDMASLIEDLIAPTANTTYHQREKPYAVKRDFPPMSEEGPRAKKRAVDLQNSAVEAAKRRETGGQRIAGQHMAARDQLEWRLAQLKKAETELKMKQREFSEELRKQQVAGHTSKQATSNGNPKSMSGLAKSAAYEIGTHPKGEKRIARIPKLTSGGSAESILPTASSQRPTVALEANAKPTGKIRMQYLHLIMDEYSKSLNEQDAYQKAIEDEAAIFAKATTKDGYLNAVMCAVKKIRNKGKSNNFPDNSKVS